MEYTLLIYGLNVHSRSSWSSGLSAEALRSAFLFYFCLSIGLDLLNSWVSRYLQQFWHWSDWFLAERWVLVLPFFIFLFFISFLLFLAFYFWQFLCYRVDFQYLGLLFYYDECFVKFAVRWLDALLVIIYFFEAGILT